MMNAEKWRHGTDYSGKVVQAPLTGLGPKLTASATARSSSPEIHLQSGHKSPCLRLCLPQQFQKITRHGHIFSIQVSSTVLIWAHLTHGSFHSCPRDVSMQQLSYNGRCTSTLCYPTRTIPCQWSGSGSDMVWPPLSPDLYDTWQFDLGNVKEKVSQRRLPTVADLNTATREWFDYFQLST